MSRITIHTACPASRKAIADALDGLSGLSSEHSIPLKSTVAGGTWLWDVSNNPTYRWHGASQNFAQGIAMTMLTDGQTKQSGSYYAAFDENSGTLLDHNCLTAPATAT
jgi:hypothetical protein